MTRSPLPIYSKIQLTKAPRRRDASIKPKVLIVKLRYKPVVPRKPITPEILLSEIRDNLDYEKRHGITAENPWRRARYHLEQLDHKDPSYVRNARVGRKMAKKVYELWLREQAERGTESRNEVGGNGGEVENEEAWSECDGDGLCNAEPDGGFGWEW